MQQPKSAMRPIPLSYTPPPLCASDFGDFDLDTTRRMRNVSCKKLAHTPTRLLLHDITIYKFYLNIYNPSAAHMSLLILPA